MGGVTADYQNDHSLQPQPYVGSQTVGEVRHRLVDAFL